jgi:hypothetical protein
MFSIASQLYSPTSLFSRTTTRCATFIPHYLGESYRVPHPRSVKNSVGFFLCQLGFLVLLSVRETLKVAKRFVVLSVRETFKGAMRRLAVVGIPLVVVIFLLVSFLLVLVNAPTVTEPELIKALEICWLFFVN